MGMAGTFCLPQHRNVKPLFYNCCLTIKSLDGWSFLSSRKFLGFSARKRRIYISLPLWPFFYGYYLPPLSIHCCHSSLLHLVHLGNSLGLPACHPFLAHSHFPISPSSALCRIEYHIRFPDFVVWRSALPQGYGSTQ
jgi:hypothetical protein